MSIIVVARTMTTLEILTTGAPAVAGEGRIHLSHREAPGRRGAGDRAHRPCGARPGRPPMPASRAQGSCSCEGSRHRSGRLHRLDAGRSGCAAEGADVVGIDSFTDYYARAIKERNLAG